MLANSVELAELLVQPEGQRLAAVPVRLVIGIPVEKSPRAVIQMQAVVRRPRSARQQAAPRPGASYRSLAELLL